MSLTKTTEEDKIEVVGTHKAIQIRTATVITENGTEITARSLRGGNHCGQH